MNLSDLNGDIQIPKPWLNIVCNTTSSLFGTYMNGGFPVTFQNFSQVTPKTITQTTPTSLIQSPVVNPNYGDLDFPILSSGIQILIEIPFTLAVAVAAIFSLGLYLNNVNIATFNIPTSPGTLAANVGVFRVGIGYDDRNHVLTVYITGGISNSSTLTALSTVSYTSGADNLFDLRGSFSVANVGNTFTAKTITSEALGLFNSE